MLLRVSPEIWLNTDLIGMIEFSDDGESRITIKDKDFKVIVSGIQLEDDDFGIFYDQLLDLKPRKQTIT